MSRIIRLYTLALIAGGALGMAAARIHLALIQLAPLRSPIGN